jgi:hypothetical protein
MPNCATDEPHAPARRETEAQQKEQRERALLDRLRKRGSLRQ